jgi:hypothetical protein
MRVQGETKAGSPCRDLWRWDERERPQVRRPLPSLTLCRFPDLSGSSRRRLGSLLGSFLRRELVLYLEGDGVGVHFVEVRRISQHGIAVATGGGEDDGQLDHDTSQLALFRPAKIRGKQLGNGVALRSGNTSGFFRPKGGLATNALVREDLRESLRTEVPIPDLGEFDMLAVKFGVIGVLVFGDKARPLLYADIVVAVIEGV